MTLIVNAGPLSAKLKMSASRVGLATAAAATAGAKVYEELIKTELGRVSHAKGARTGSAPGEPPERVTGTLQASVTVGPPRRYGPATYMAAAGPTDFVALFHEYGTKHEPAHPFIEKAVHGGELQAHEAVVKVWEAAIQL
jgi:HK97 gp10 family phage protein